jgi:hypothetical protein
VRERERERKGESKISAGSLVRLRSDTTFMMDKYGYILFIYLLILELEYPVFDSRHEATSLLQNLNTDSGDLQPPFQSVL